MPLLAGYTRISKLGAGAFATTYLVQHDRTLEKLVLKRVPCRHMRAANAALQEVKLLLACHHEGIVGYHDFFLDSDDDDNIVICLLMEFCDGGDLWERIATAQREGAAVAPVVAAGWLLQIAAALRYLHAHEILHRDIKLENIFITRDGAVAKLGDFGLAKAIERESAEGGGGAKTQCGTPDYIRRAAAARNAVRRLRDVAADAAEPRTNFARRGRWDGQAAQLSPAGAGAPTARPGPSQRRRAGRRALAGRFRCAAGDAAPGAGAGGGAFAAAQLEGVCQGVSPEPAPAGRVPRPLVRVRRLLGAGIAARAYLWRTPAVYFVRNSRNLRARDLAVPRRSIQ